MSNIEIKNHLERRLGEKSAEYRARILNLIESHLGTSPNWKIIRSQLLKLFSERGLSGDIQHILDSAFCGGKS